MSASLSALEKKLGYQFSHQNLLVRALTHRSYSADNNERLEYLGDSILNFVIADALYKQFPGANEGQLSRLRANMVRGKTLAEIARDMSLSDFLNMGTGELRSGGFNRDSILSDALEAIIGAIYEDDGLSTAKSRVLAWYESRLGELSLADSGKDAKTRLQEYLQAKKIPLPDYQVIDITGKAPDQVFTVKCEAAGIKDRVTGVGSNRRIAEQVAASSMLSLLGEVEGIS